MGRILITEFMEQQAVDRLRAVHNVVYEPELVDRQADIPGAITRADGLIVRNRTQVTAHLIDQAPQLRVVGRLGVGLDNIDLQACEARSIAVRPALGANAVAVAEYVIGALVSLRRRVYGSTSQILAGGWPRRDLTGGEMAGMQVGLVGYGSIAQQVARRAFALDMTVVAHDPLLSDDFDWGRTKPISLDELVVTSDAVSIHVPLLTSTKRLFDRRRIAQMKDGAFLVNTARGGIVDEAAVADALSAGELGGAALDVFANEPPTSDDLARFRGVPNLILTPHIAGVTRESNVRVSSMVADAVLEELANA